MKKIIKLTENDLLKIVKRVIREQQESNLTSYTIIPIKSGAPKIRINVDLNNKKIFLPNGQEVGFMSTDDLRKNIGSTKFKNGMEYLNQVFDSYGVGKYIQNQSCTYYGFVFASSEEGGEPIIAGVNKGDTISCKGSKGIPGGEMESVTTTTTTTPTPLEQKLTLDLKDLFFFDCPGMKNCGSKGGSNTDPLIDMNNLTKVQNLGKLLASLKDWPVIKNTKFYVVGYASAENKNSPDFMSHNLKLSKNRAQYIAMYLNNGIKKGGGDFTVEAIGNGPTENFGSKLEDNRRIILTTDPKGFSPVKIKITKDRTGRIINVELL